VIACVRARARDRAGLGLLAWALSLFLVFSAISGKRSGYLLPLYPAFAILIARHLLDPKPAWAGRAGSALAALLLVLTGATLLGLRPLAGWLPGIVSGRNAAALQGLATVLTPGRVAMAAGLGCAILGLGVCLFFFRNRIGARGTVFTLALATALASLAAHTTFVHAFDRAFSVAPLGELVAREHPRGERLVLAPENFSGIVNLYTGARHYDVLATPEALRAALDEQGRLFVVTHHHFRDSLEADLRARLETRGAHRIGRDLMVVLAEAPARRSGN
jgi:4-amino-4-deoxy-L-arabinose transferase-like glycosyltransferase